MLPAATVPEVSASKAALPYSLLPKLQQNMHVCHSCLNISEYNVTFTARNFEYILHWSKYDLVPDISFNVQYKRYGQTEWLLLPGCQNITRVYCNLTHAIVGDEEDFMTNQYFGRVKALSTNCTSDWVISKRLNPRDDTYLILPKLNYIQHVNSITLFVPTPPVPIRGRDKQPVTVEDLYKNDHFEYNLNFFNSEKKDIWQKTQTDRTFEVSGLSPDMEYNGNVYILVGNERKSDIQYFVVRTLPDYSFITLIASLVAVFVIVLGTGLLLFSCKYIKQQVQTPNSLVFTKSTSLPLLVLPKDKVISSLTVGFFPAIFMQNYYQIHQETSRNKEIPGNSQPHMYASQSHGAITPGQDSAVDTQESYSPQNNDSSLVSSVHYGKVFDRTSSNVAYLQNTTQDPCSNIYYDDPEEDFQINTLQPSVVFDGDMSTASINIGFQFDLFSNLLSKESNTLLNNITSMGLLSSVTVRDDRDFTAQIDKTEEHPPVLLSDDLNFDGFISNQMEEQNLQQSFFGQGGNLYTLPYPVENSAPDTLDRTSPYKKQCIL
ncbi:interleukin-22 receptor subunit alpha-1 [Bufo gargarizans]|uniref:interleukin-22 receptor subunit alpha-1 n=1 Tax=Bufo gargarizans TaxID=30331 RepID=UPI001CF3805B|nr:interleukin-22 receptor subunit alpha-1 [Bufo gargarizans]